MSTTVHPGGRTGADDTGFFSKTSVEQIIGHRSHFRSKSSALRQGEVELTPKILHGVDRAPECVDALVRVPHDNDGLRLLGDDVEHHGVGVLELVDHDVVAGQARATELVELQIAVMRHGHD